jgi:hypothetical protein
MTNHRGTEEQGKWKGHNDKMEKMRDNNWMTSQGKQQERRQIGMRRDNDGMTMRTGGQQQKNGTRDVVNVPWAIVKFFLSFSF